MASSSTRGSVYDWVQAFTPYVIDAARTDRTNVGKRWRVDETYLKIDGRWRYLFRAVDEHGQIVDVYVSNRRDAAAAQAFFERAINASGSPLPVLLAIKPSATRLLSVPSSLRRSIVHRSI